MGRAETIDLRTARVRQYQQQVRCEALPESGEIDHRQVDKARRDPGRKPVRQVHHREVGTHRMVQAFGAFTGTAPRLAGASVRLES